MDLAPIFRVALRLALAALFVIRRVSQKHADVIGVALLAANGFIWIGVVSPHPCGYRRAAGQRRSHADRAPVMYSSG